MYIIAIGWMFVSTLAALTEPSIVGGIMTFLFTGLLPCGLIFYLAGSKMRRQRRRYQELMAEKKKANGHPAARDGDNTPLS